MINAKIAIAAEPRLRFRCWMLAATGRRLPVHAVRYYRTTCPARLGGTGATGETGDAALDTVGNLLGEVVDLLEDVVGVVGGLVGLDTDGLLDSVTGLVDGLLGGGGTDGLLDPVTDTVDGLLGGLSLFEEA